MTGASSLRGIRLAARSVAIAISTLGLAAPFAAAESNRPIVYLSNNNSTASVTSLLHQPENPNDIPLAGDWDGNGTDTVGTYNPATRQVVKYSSNAATAWSTDSLDGNSGDIPIVGHWNASMTGDSVALYRPSNRTLYYPTGSDTAALTGVIVGGNPNMVPFAGNWDTKIQDPQQIDSLGLWEPTPPQGGSAYTKNSNTAVDYTTVLSNRGNEGDLPVIGDWDGDGSDTVRLFRPGTTGPNHFYLDYTGGTQGSFTSDVTFGNPGMKPVIGDWDGNKTDTIGLFDPATHTFYLSTSNTAPNAAAGTIALPKLNVEESDTLLVGDWDGDSRTPANPNSAPKTMTIGSWRTLAGTNSWSFSNSITAPVKTAGNFGVPGDQPLIGRWNSALLGDTLAIYRPSTRTLLYPTTGNASWLNGEVNIGGNPAMSGNPADLPIVGDWNGDGIDTLGLFRGPGPTNGPTNTVYIKNSNTDPNYTLVFQNQGNPGDKPIVGDWEGDYKDTVGLFQQPTPTATPRFVLTNAAGVLNATSIAYGNPGDEPLIGDWNGNGTDTIGVKHILPPNYGGLNSWLDAPSEYDAWIDALRAAPSDTNATWRYNSLHALEQQSVVQAMDAKWPSSRTYGGPNWKIDTDADANGFIGGFRAASSNSAANAMYAGLPGDERSVVEQRIRATLINELLVVDVATGQYWFLDGGLRLPFSTTEALDGNGFVAADAIRVITNAVSHLPVGETLTPDGDGGMVDPALATQYGGWDIGTDYFIFQNLINGVYEPVHTLDSPASASLHGKTTLRWDKRTGVAAQTRRGVFVNEGTERISKAMALRDVACIAVQTKWKFGYVRVQNITVGLPPSISATVGSSHYTNGWMWSCRNGTSGRAPEFSLSGINYKRKFLRKVRVSICWSEKDNGPLRDCDDKEVGP